MSEITRFKYSGAALPGNGAVVTLFSTVTAFGMASGFAMLGLDRFLLDLTNDAAGTLKVYQSTDRGATWVQIVADAAISAAASHATNQKDYVVEPYADWKLEWTNGATPQTTFTVNMVAVNSRNATT